MDNLTIGKWGNSLGLRIPKEVAEAGNLALGDELRVSVEDGAVILKKQAPIPRYDFSAIKDSFHAASEEPELDWGQPQGREII